MKKQELETYLRFLKSIQKPDLEGVWLDGRDCAEHQLSLRDNPYSKDSKEHLYWNEGWWAGFYEEEPLSLLSESTSVVTDNNKTLSNIMSKKAINNSISKGIKIISEWVEDISFIAGTFMTGFIIYELVDIAL